MGYGAPSPRQTSGSGTGGWIAAAGGALVLISVFLPWISGGGDSLTGWEGLDTIRECIDDGFCGTGDLFVQTEPFVFVNTLTPIILGGVLLLLGVAAALVSPSAGGRGAMVALALAVAAFAAITAIVNIYQVIDEGTEDVSVGFGLILWLLAAGAGAFGAFRAMQQR